MARLKGMDTWIWVAGGIVVAMLCFVMFLQLFSSLTIQGHTQTSQESLSVMATGVNALCDALSGQSSAKTFRFSSIVENVFAYSNGTYPAEGERSSGTRICMNISGKVSCEKVKCTVEADPFLKKSKITGFLEKLRGDVEYYNYKLELTRTDCGVSILNKGSKPACYCEAEDMDMPIYYNYNGPQPILLSRGSSIVLADTYGWINPDRSSKQLLSNVAGYFGGKKILIVYEENRTSPRYSPLYDALMEIGQDSSNSANAQGYVFYMKKHDKHLDFGGYDQIWLVTPGFCDSDPQSCGKYESWSPTEIQGIMNASRNGTGIFIITDSGSRNGVATSRNLDTINTILSALGYSIRQINSCLGDCSSNQSFNASVDSNDVLTYSLGNYKIKSAASFDLKCRYVSGFTPPALGPNVLVSLDEQPVVLLYGRVLILLDTTPFLNTGHSDPNSVKFLSNVVDYFGKSILVVWEDSCLWNTSSGSQGLSCPLTSSVRPEDSEIIRILDSKGAAIDSFRHDTQLTPEIMKGYNQVWIFRPGWCGYSSQSFVRSYQQYCTPFIGWNSDELQSISNYVSSGGNLTIFLDYSPYLPKQTVNDLFYHLGLALELRDGMKIGKFTFELSDHPLLQGVEKYPIKAVAIVVNKTQS